MFYFNKKITQKEYTNTKNSKLYKITRGIVYALGALVIPIKLLFFKIRDRGDLISDFGQVFIIIGLLIFSIFLYFSIQDYKIEYFKYKERGKNLDYVILQPHTRDKILIIYSILGIIFFLGLLLRISF